MTKFELEVLKNLLEDWAEDDLNITGLNSCDALLDLLDELRTSLRSGKKIPWGFWGEQDDR